MPESSTSQVSAIRGRLRHALVPGRLDIGGIHEARRVFIRLDAVDPVIADALDAASLAAGPIELVGEPDRRAPEGAPGEFALITDVCGIRVVVTPFVVLGRARLGITEQSDPRVSETPMAYAELIGAVAAVPGAGQLPGVIELLLGRSHPGGRGCGSARSCRRRGRAPP